MSQDLQPTGGSGDERSLARRVLRAPLVGLKAVGRFIKERQKVVTPILIVVGSILFTGVLIALKPAPEKKEPEPVSMLVEVVPAASATVDYVITTQGTVLPRTETSLVVEVSGKIVKVSPSFVAGGFFDKGDVLLEIDPSDYEVAVMSAEAGLAGARARLLDETARSEQAAKDFKALGRGGEPSDLVLRKPQLAETNASVRARLADLEKARRDLGRTRLKAPYDGMVVEKGADLGRYVTVGTAVGKTYAVGVAEIRLPLTDRDLAYLDLPTDETGEAVRPMVTLHGTVGGREQSWEAEIVRTEGVVDVRSRVLYAVAQVDDPYRLEHEGTPLRFGTFVRAEIAGLQVNDVIPLPRHVVRGKDQVLVMDDEKRLRVKTVEVARADTEVVYVAGGLEEGEQVVMTAIDVPVDGMLLRTGDEEAVAEGENGDHESDAEGDPLEDEEDEDSVVDAVVSD